MKKRIALYPGTFDPITRGHTDIILRAAKLFDEVVVGVAESADKKTLLTLKERTELVKKVLSSNSNITVMNFAGLTISLTKKIQANIIVRGIRMAADLHDEALLHHMNKAMVPDLETVFLMPTAEHAHISSSIVKEINTMGGDISPFVEPHVEEILAKYK